MGTSSISDVSYLTRAYSCCFVIFVVNLCAHGESQTAIEGGKKAGDDAPEYPRYDTLSCRLTR